MIVCDVSAVDKLIDLYYDNLSVFYKGKRFDLYDLRDEFIDNNIICSIDDHIVSSKGIHKDEIVVVSIDPHQEFIKDDIVRI